MLAACAPHFQHPAADSLTGIGEDEAGELYATHMAWGGVFRLFVQ
jgi:hypothetical protein